MSLLEADVLSEKFRLCAETDEILAEIRSSTKPPAAATATKSAEALLPTQATASGGRASTPSVWKQIRIMISKRMTCTRRDRKTLMAQHGVPTGLVALTLLILCWCPSATSPPPRPSSWLRNA